METEEILAKQIWEVLLKIKEQDVLSYWSEFGVLRFESATENEKKILLWLHDEKAIELLNLSRPKGIVNIPGDISLLDGIKFKIIQTTFDEIYGEYETLAEAREGIKTPLECPKGEINKIITTRNIRGKEKGFLQALSDMKPVSASKLREETDTKNVKALKFAVQRKLKGTGWNIKSPQRSGWGKDTFYQLEFLTQ